MTEGDTSRLVAWSIELREVHRRLRAALSAARESVDSGDPGETLTRELRLLCHGFCVALTAHHEGEDRQLFPAIAAAHPELAPTLAKLVQDHSMIAHLVASLEAAVHSGESRERLALHIEGIGAIMESHFRYEERQLLTVLEALSLDAEPRQVLGPL